MSERYLSTEEVAKKAGVSAVTIQSYHSRSQMPKADKKEGRHPQWKASTIEHWLTHRAGQGTRTDLKRKK